MFLNSPNLLIWALINHMDRLSAIPATTWAATAHMAQAKTAATSNI
jgi:hypothetical protein